MNPSKSSRLLTSILWMKVTHLSLERPGFLSNRLGFCQHKIQIGHNWLASFPVGRACSPGPHGPVDGLKHVSWMRTRKPPSLTSFWQLACNWRFKSWGSLGTIQESTADERKRINLNLKEETERLSFEIWNHCNPNTQKCNVERFCSNLHDIAKYHTEPPGRPGCPQPPHLLGQEPNSKVRCTMQLASMSHCRGIIQEILVP